MKDFNKRKGLGSGLIVVLLLTGIIVMMPNAFAHDRTQALEQKVQELENMLRSVQSELQRVRSESESKAVEAQQTAVEAKAQATAAREEASRVVKQEEAGGKHMVFFRGGFTHARQERNGSSIQSNVAPVGAQDTASQDGWYTGAGFDFNLTDDVWGLLPKTSVYAELMFEYKNFSKSCTGKCTGK